MTKNIGTTDRMLRISGGVLLLVLALYSGIALFDNHLLMLASLIIGVILIGTEFLNFCPLYRVFGIRTCKV